jgi:O-acetyl-ADP-ribose deacetylase (regulator of RNase III)
MIIEIIQGDITKIEVDAIVNSANTSLLGGGGVDGAIHRAGGIKIFEDCQRIRNKQGGCKVGEAVITTAGLLPSKFVIHTVGPVWCGGNNKEENLLQSAYISCLKMALANKIQTIAFPSISTGIYHFPRQIAAKIAIESVISFSLTTNDIKKVIFVCFDSNNYNIYYNLLKDKTLI